MTPEDEALTRKMIAEANKPLTDQLTDVATTVKRQGEEFPGMIKRQTAQLTEDITKSVTEALKPATKPNDPPPPKPTENEAKLAAAVAKMEEELVNDKKSGALTIALSKVGFVKGVKIEEELARLTSKVEVKEGGKVIFKSTKKLATGEEIPEEVSVEEGVKREYAERTYMVKAEGVDDGSGATGKGDKVTFEKEPTYEELLDKRNVGLAAKFSAANPDRYNAIIMEGIAKLGKGRIG